MRFICERDDLSKCISIVTRAMPARSPLSALEGILVEAGNNEIKMRCSDMTLTIDSSFPARVEEEGALVLPGRLFSEMVRKLPAGEVSIIQEGDLAIKIQFGKTKLTLHGMDSQEFPELDESSIAKPLDLRQGDLKEMIRQTLFAVASDETKPILTGELLEVSEGKFSVVALDGYRLALRTEPLESANEEVKFVVPSKSLAEISKLFEDDDSTAQILIGDNHAVVEMGNTKIYTRLLDGEYIKYNTILPGEHNTRVRIDKAALADATERASLMAREGKNNLIRMNLDEDMLSITANSEMGDVYEEIPIYMEGTPLKIAFNARYLTDVLRVIEDEEILMDFVSNLSPCVIRPVEGEGYLYLVLPVRIYDN